MKFRGKMTDLRCMKQFSNIVQTLSRLSRSCVLRICEDSMHFIISQENMGHRGGMVWCTIDQAHFFAEYHMSGTKPDFNEIYLDFNPELLIKALNSLKFSQVITKSVKIKLTNKEQPCLTFEVELPSMALHSRLCVHDVPVTLIPRRDWNEYKPPDLPTFDVSIQIPNLKLLRGVVDRMKGLHFQVVLSANHEGTLSVCVGTETTNIAMHFLNLEVVGGSGGGPTSDESEMFSVRLDAKKLSTVLASELINPQRVVCHICDDKMLHMILEHEDVQMYYSVYGVAA